ncbi:aldehyde dehydrogenase family protein [Thermus oshimai]
MVRDVHMKMLLAGDWVEGSRVIEVRDPQDGSLVSTVAAAGEAEARRAIELGVEGARAAAQIPVHERMGILSRAADYVERHAERFATTIAREGSKTIREARLEVARCVMTLRLSAEEARRLHGETLNFDQRPGSENCLGYYFRFPVGLVLAITPFNDPLNLVAHKVGPAIAAGNAVIVKPATATPLSALLLAEALVEAGLPRGVLSVIPGLASEIGDLLVTHPAVRLVSFTGGREVGEAIARKAGLKKLQMELGSNSPVIVLQDADLEDAVERCVSGAFWAAGQNCLGVQRIYVQKEVYAEFRQRFVERAARYRVGDKLDERTDMGPLISEKEASRVGAWVSEALGQGAKLLTGGRREGAFYWPTVLEEVPPDARVACEEVFGPVVSLFGVKDLDEALRLANGVNYGLQAGIFTRDLELALKAVRDLEVGGVMVNDSSDYRLDAMPFGGVKGSGIGREGVRFAIEEMTETKVVCFRLRGF